MRKALVYMLLATALFAATLAMFAPGAASFVFGTLGLIAWSEALLIDSMWDA